MISCDLMYTKRQTVADTIAFELIIASIIYMQIRADNHDDL
jgi:hypothetical protein